MRLKFTDHSPEDDKGTRVALIYALLAESLNCHYEHGQWLTAAQGATLAADWLARSRRSLAADERRRLAELADQLARRVAAGLSRQAGLLTAHELMASLDPNYHSEIGQAMMVQCESLLDASGLLRN